MTVDDLTDVVAGWPEPDRAALAVTTADELLGACGDRARVSCIASISKVIAALAVLVAVEEGTVDLETEIGPTHTSVRRHLAHATGNRRVYDNANTEIVAAHLAERAGMPFDQYQRDAVLVPLGMTATELRGSPAADVWSSVDDLTLLARELLRPWLIDPATLAEATAVQFPEMRGVVPGFGSHDPNPWGLGVEIRGHKDPHWTGPRHPPSTFGHFGATGTYLWVDPTVGLAAVAVSGTDFGEWAVQAWPATNAALLDTYGPVAARTK